MSVTPDIGTMLLLLVTGLLTALGSLGTLLYLFAVVLLIEQLVL